MIIQTYTSGSSVALLGVPQSPFVSTAIFMVMVPKLLGVDTPVCHVSTKNLSSFVSRRDAVVSLGSSQWSRRERDGGGEFVVGWKGGRGERRESGGASR